MKYPSDQIEFEKMFMTEQSCIDYLASVRWPNGFICPLCASIIHWKKTKGRYECKDCNTETSVKSGTIFHKTTKSLSLWYRAIWWMVAQKNGVSAKGLQKILGIRNYQTSWTWLHKLRRLMVLDNRSKLSGVVEVDETLVGGKKSGKRGRGAEGKSLVVIAIEVIGRKTGRVRLSRIQSASSKELNKFIVDNIEPSSTIITDGWTGYNQVKELGYIHQIQKPNTVKDDEEILPNIHRIASLLKRWLLGTHQSYLNQNKMEYYLDEYVFRYNRRNSKSRGLLFLRLLEQAAITAPVSYKEIIKENHGS